MPERSKSRADQVVSGESSRYHIKTLTVTELGSSQSACTRQKVLVALCAYWRDET